MVVAMVDVGDVRVAVDQPAVLVHVLMAAGEPVGVNVVLVPRCTAASRPSRPDQHEIRSGEAIEPDRFAFDVRRIASSLLAAGRHLLCRYKRATNVAQGPSCLFRIAAAIAQCSGPSTRP